MSIYRIRAFAPADATRVREIVTQALATMKLPLAPDGVDADLADIPSAYRGGCFLVVEASDAGKAPRVLGCGGIHDEGHGVFELRKMYFDEAIRGRGLGRKLLSVLLDVARRKGGRRMRLETNSRMREAIKLYEKFGFVREEGAASIPPRCDIVMHRVL